VRLDATPGRYQKNHRLRGFGAAGSGVLTYFP
jgi:hypothetical protein